MFIPDIWQWSELTSFGDLPSPRDFAAASAIGNRKIVMSVVLACFLYQIASIDYYFVYDFW